MDDTGIGKFLNFEEREGGEVCRRKGGYEKMDR
jgi:hypothetical protein